MRAEARTPSTASAVVEPLEYLGETRCLFVNRIIGQLRKYVVLEAPCSLHSLEATRMSIPRASHYFRQMIGSSLYLTSTNIFQYVNNELGKLHVEFGVLGIPSTSQSVGAFLAFYLPRLLSILSRQTASSFISTFLVLLATGTSTRVWRHEPVIAKGSNCDSLCATAQHM
jgi:hypothetical protein